MNKKKKVIARTSRIFAEKMYHKPYRRSVIIHGSPRRRCADGIAVQELGLGSPAQLLLARRILRLLAVKGPALEVDVAAQEGCGDVSGSWTGQLSQRLWQIGWMTAGLSACGQGSSLFASSRAHLCIGQSSRERNALLRQYKITCGTFATPPR